MSFMNFFDSFSPEIQVQKENETSKRKQFSKLVFLDVVRLCNERSIALHAVFACVSKKSPNKRRQLTIQSSPNMTFWEELNRAPEFNIIWQLLRDQYLQQGYTQELVERLHQQIQNKMKGYFNSTETFSINEQYQNLQKEKRTKRKISECDLLSEQLNLCLKDKKGFKFTTKQFEKLQNIVSEIEKQGEVSQKLKSLGLRLSEYIIKSQSVISDDEMIRKKQKFS